MRASSPLEGKELQPRTRRAFLIATCAVVAVGVILVGVRGCAFMPWNKSAAAGTVRVIISKDFGGSPMKDRRVHLKAGQTAMDLVKQVADVRTEYGGGFVSSIEGLSSSGGGDARSDWFYYVNGILSGSGAGSYEVRGGDCIWWDYHTWSGKNMASAVVGAYPMPFTRGLRQMAGRTVAVYGQGMEPLARQVGGFLEKGGARLAYSGDVAGFKKGGAPSIAFLTFDQARTTPWVGTLLGQRGAGGAFLTFEGDGLVPLDSAGKPDPSAGDLIGAVVSCGSGIGDASPVWLVLCGPGGAAEASRLLNTGAGGLESRFGVAIKAGGQLISLPR